MTSIKRPLHAVGYCLAMALATSLELPALASPSDVPAVAQAGSSLVGQCRAVNKATAVYKERSTSSVVSFLKMSDRVTLAENAGQNGFIAVSAPSQGFVQAVNLKPCGGGGTPPVVTPPTPDAKKLCRQVARTAVMIQNNGLNIRSEASDTATIVGGIAPGATLTLTTAPATSKVDAGRVWIQISAPTAGWVSNGFQGDKGNLVMCP
jgi:hypothetical protein